MRRFLTVFNVTQQEFDDRRFFQHKLNIITTMRRTHGVLLAIRETGKVFVASTASYQRAEEYDLRRVDFSAPSEVTHELGERFTELKQAIANNLQDKSIRYFGRTLSLNDVQQALYRTQLEIIS
ncbi:hypothetical protein pEaSNUABM35_00254 [Erwinia phage pEa_SNUABM_35]|uniref:Uncharacterized protein n=1 Tax=Erwinia phage pEa_SNUABM_35 TaxID=2869557 RepID=A0AAE7XPE0_9CAUD|nr:hypothetical protein MPK65_gp254 [Erwinia phage pEa_SNUABM_35]QZE60171.1 hypothetical protein pEaSNUABM35_00254 [Erwinia phage pEa_SNUABM_35]QZE60507.1 hypothetical protein pEaSNUABM36_00254 [Erwinia phage pEa_SNUABM_36]